MLPYEITKYLGFGTAVVLSRSRSPCCGIYLERLSRRFYNADQILKPLVTFGTHWSPSRPSASSGTAPLSASIPPAFAGSSLLGDLHVLRYRTVMYSRGSRRVPRRMANCCTRPRRPRRECRASSGLKWCKRSASPAALYDRDRHDRWSGWRRSAARSLHRSDQGTEMGAEIKRSHLSSS